MVLRVANRALLDGGDVVVVIYIKGDETAADRSAAIARVVDELKERLRTPYASSRLLTLGDLRMDRDRHEVARGGRRIHLAPMEYALLEYLMLYRDIVHSEAALMETVFGAGKDGRFNTLWVHMHRLRKKVDGHSATRLLHTVRGAGYILKTPLSADGQALPA